jgi:hypothetical protein
MAEHGRLIPSAKEYDDVTRVLREATPESAADEGAA